MEHRDFWISIPVNRTEFTQITETAVVLGMSRAAYVRLTVKKDLARRGVLAGKECRILCSPIAPPCVDSEENLEAESSEHDGPRKGVQA